MTSFFHCKFSSIWQSDMDVQNIFENVIKIKLVQTWLKNNYENDMHKMMCHHTDNVIIQ